MQSIIKLLLIVLLFAVVFAAPNSNAKVVESDGHEEVKTVGDGIFCASCLSVSSSVINLGCNATTTAIGNLCGNLFAPVCTAVLEDVCSGACNIEECAAQSCCLFKLCSGSSC